MLRLGLRFQLLLLALLLFFVVPSFVDFYSDWLWYGETNYQHVFLRGLTTQMAMGLVTFVIAFLLLAGNLRLTLRVTPRREFVVMTPDGPRTISVDPLRLRPLLYGASAVAALLAATFASSQWDRLLYFIYATPFGAVDPILGRDIGFYVFSLPFFQFLQGLGLTLVMVTLVGVAVAYGLAGAVQFDPLRGVRLQQVAVRHLSWIAAVLFVLLAFGAWLGQAGLLTSDSGLFYGASYVDVHARLPVLRITLVAALVAAVLAAYQAFSERRWPILAALAVYFGVALTGSAYGAMVQRFVVAPNEQVKETPYIVHNIAATRKAFGLEGVVERELSGDALLSREDIDRNATTLKNVPLWDHQPLLDTFSQIQEIRTYYDFVSVHNDRYQIDGEYRQIMLSARELNSASLPNRTWINEHLTFTHGYGLTLGPVNQVTSEGLPVLFIKNLPPESSVDLQVTEPSIYYGELANDHVFVRTRTREFHYPKGEDNVYSTYTGDGGVPVDSFFRKLLFSIKFRSLKTLLSNDLTPETRVMYYRRVPERVRKIAPFLTFEEDRYLSIADGRLYWVQDAYTTSNRYPYSSPVSADINYIRNSVKTVVDAYSGRTSFYLIDERDPIAQTVAKAFPGLLQPLSEMPEGLRTRLRYPQGIFQIQTAVFSTYHMANPAVFYNKEDQWEVPSLDTRAGQSSRMLPWYTIMRLPGEDEAEFIQMLPFTPRQKDNLAAWMVARSDGENYGHLMVFQFPKQKVIFGPRQVVARISQDQVISPQVTLWNQQGSEVIQGTLLVIPIEESLIYIRPLYLRSAGGRIPELKRVIVAYQNQIVMEETLEAALNRIFPPGLSAEEIAAAAAPIGGDGGVAAAMDEPTPPPADTAQRGGAAPAASTTSAVALPADAAALAAEARATYQRALKAQREGSWALYGEEIKRLGEILDRLQRTSTGSSRPEPDPR